MSKKFFKSMGHALFNGGYSDSIADTDHPSCPRCSTTMDFHGDDMNLAIGDEFWVCPNCGFTFSYDDVEPYVEPNYD